MAIRTKTAHGVCIWMIAFLLSLSKHKLDKRSRIRRDGGREDQEKENKCRAFITLTTNHARFV